MWQPMYNEYDTYYLMYVSQQSYRIGTLIVLISQMSKLRPTLGNLSEAIYQFIAKKRLETNDLIQALMHLISGVHYGS